MGVRVPLTLHVLFLGLVGLLLQEVVLDLLVPDWLPTPHVLIVLLVLLGFTEHSLRGCVLAFSLGFLLDLNGGSLLGPWSGAYIISFALMSVLAQRIYVDSVLTLVTIVALADFVTTLLFYLLITFVPDHIVFVGSGTIPWVTIGLQALVSGLAAPLVARLYRAATESRISHSSNKHFAHEGKGIW